jgi:hypothetical protein
MPHKTLSVGGNAAFPDLFRLPAHQVHRHGVEHLVAEHDAVQGVGQRVQPGNTIQQVRCARLQQRALAFAQVRAEVEDAVLLRQAAQPLELKQDVGSEFAAACTQFGDDRRAQRHDFGGLTREDTPEQRRELGRGDEIALGAEFARAGGVVAQARRIQRQFHIAGKRYPAVLVGDVIENEPAQRFAVCEGVGAGRR